MKNIIVNLKNYYKTQSTEAEKNVIRYILDNPRDVISMDIHNLAKKGFCSSTTIVRICKKIGFSGFKEAKIALMDELKFNDELFETINFDNDLNEPNEIVKKVVVENLNAIKNTYNLLDFNQLDNIVELIDKSKVIRLYGIGASFLVAKDFQQKLERINKITVLYEDTHLQMISSTNINSDELAFVISYSGQTSEIIEIAENIKANGANLISITKYNNNKIMNIADFKLFVPNIEGLFRISAGSSRISQLCIIDIVYNLYIEKYHEKYLDRFVDTGKLLEKEEIEDILD